MQLFTELWPEVYAEHVFSKKLWRELHKVLHRSHCTTLPTCESSKSLADHFATFFSNKIMKICESFSSSESCNKVHSPFDPPTLTVFTQVNRGGQGGRVVTLSPPTSEAGVRSLSQPEVGKLVVAYRWSAVYSTEP